MKPWDEKFNADDGLVAKFEVFEIWGRDKSVRWSRCRASGTSPRPNHNGDASLGNLHPKTAWPPCKARKLILSNYESSAKWTWKTETIKFKMKLWQDSQKKNVSELTVSSLWKPRLPSLCTGLSRSILRNEINYRPDSHYKQPRCA